MGPFTNPQQCIRRRASYLGPLFHRPREGSVGGLAWRQNQARSVLVSARQGSRETECEEVYGWDQILARPWLLSNAATKTTKVGFREGRWRVDEIGDFSGPCFHVIRDDLLHPMMGGNKLRKLDAIIPLLQAHEVTDVVTCGGCQSAHTAAVAVACAEVGMKAHLLLRGERPAIPTGYNLVAGMYGYVTYIPRSEYADRHAMLHKYALQVAGDPSCVISIHHKILKESSFSGWKMVPGEVASGNGRKVAILNEGAGDCHALPGLIRLVDYLSHPSKFGKKERLHVIVDSGTGTTAVGLALGIALKRLPWKVVGVMLADTREGYEKQADRLLAEFAHEYHGHTWEVELCQKGSDLPILWQERCQPRKFGRILRGEIEICQRVARETGILLDPIYTLAGWESANKLCHSAAGDDAEEVVLLHTGGTLGLFGLAQRYPLQF